MSSRVFTVSVENGLIGNELNSTILSVLLWGRYCPRECYSVRFVDPFPGIYTIVYAGTLYLYCESQKLQILSQPIVIDINQ